MKKKGFTLVEVIISLVLIMLIGTITIISLKKDETDTTDKSKEELETAVDVTTDKLKSNNSLKQYVASESNGDATEIISYFCLTKETLIKEGIITEDNAELKKMESGKYIKVSQNEVGAYSFKYVDAEECSYLKSEINNETLENTEAKIIDNLSAEENGYYLSQQISQKDNVENAYEFKMDFKFNTGRLSNVTFRPNVYTIFVVDGSGSMCDYSIYGYSSSKRATKCLNNDTDFVKARNASISLSKTLTDVNSSSNDWKNYVSAISFDNDVDKNLDFKTTELTTSDFKFGDGGTKYSSALSAAYDKIKNITKENNRFFVIFLTDGQDNYGSYSTYSDNIKKFLKPVGSETEYGKLITVGYNYNGEVLSDIASKDCKSDRTCYYNASSSVTDDDENSILSVFSGFLEVIEREVMCSAFKRAKITIDLTENFNFSDGTNTKIIEITEEELECDKNDLTSNLQTRTLIDNALYDLTFLEPDEETLPIGTHEFSIIKNISIKFYDADNNESSEILLNEEEFPTITLNIDKIEVIN